jgi:hypothetical protein
MTTNLSQNSDTSLRPFGREDISASKFDSRRLPEEFGDREIEMYMLQPKATSAALESLYAAIRTQMVLDGCA